MDSACKKEDGRKGRAVQDNGRAVKDNESLTAREKIATNSPVSLEEPPLDAAYQVFHFTTITY